MSVTNTGTTETLCLFYPESQDGQQLQLGHVRQHIGLVLQVMLAAQCACQFSQDVKVLDLPCSMQALMYT